MLFTSKQVNEWYHISPVSFTCVSITVVSPLSRRLSQTDRVSAMSWPDLIWPDLSWAELVLITRTLKLILFHFDFFLSVCVCARTKESWKMLANRRTALLFLRSPFVLHPSSSTPSTSTMSLQKLLHDSIFLSVLYKQLIIPIVMCIRMNTLLRTWD